MTSTGSPVIWAAGSSSRTRSPPSPRASVRRCSRCLAATLACRSTSCCISTCGTASRGGAAMYVIRLPDGNLLVPESATAHDGQLVSDAYVEIGPADRDYERFAASAMTQDEIDDRVTIWRAGRERPRRQFLEFLAR